MEKKDTNRVQNVIEKWHAANAQALGQYHAEKKLQQYERLYQEYNGKADLSPEEKRSLLAVHRVMAKLHRDTQKGAIENALSKTKNPVARFVSSFVKTIRENRANRLHASQSAPKRIPEQQAVKLPKLKLKEVTAKQSAEHLSKILDIYGLPQNIPAETSKAIAAKSPSFKMDNVWKGEAGEMAYSVVFNRSVTGRYYPDSLAAKFIQPIVLPNAKVEGVDLQALDRRMQKIAWANKDYFATDSRVSADTRENHRILSAVNGIFRDLLKLKTSSDPAAISAQNILAYKYFKDTPTEKIIGNMDALSKKYEININVPLSVSEHPAFTLRQIYNMAQGRPVSAEGQWYFASKREAAKNGVAIPQAIPGSQTYDVAAILKKYGIDDPSIKSAMEQGDLVTAHINKNGISIQRVFFADPLGNDVHIDLEASKKQGLYQPLDKALRTDMEKYARRTDNKLVAIKETLNEEGTENTHSRTKKR